MIKKNLVRSLPGRFSVLALGLALFLSLGLGQNAEAAKRKLLPYETDDDPPVSLSYTHLLPSTSVIPGGEFVIGTTLGYGFFDVFDVTTNLFLDIAQVFNVEGKVHLFRNDEFAAAVFAGYTSQSVKIFNSSTPTVATNTYSAVQPGAVISYYIFPQLTGDSGFTYTARNPSLAKSDEQPKDGFVQGNFVNQEFTIGLTHKVALSFGGSYDLTYDIWGAGASIHVSGLQIGAHYFFNVGVDSFLPILGFTYALD